MLLRLALWLSHRLLFGLRLRLCRYFWAVIACLIASIIAALASVNHTNCKYLSLPHSLSMFQISDLFAETRLLLPIKLLRLPNRQIEQTKIIPAISRHAALFAPAARPGSHSK